MYRRQFLKVLGTAAGWSLGGGVTRIQPGKARLRTWFTDEDGASRGAYYVYAARVS